MVARLHNYGEGFEDYSEYSLETRMDAYDKLPPVVRQELQIALHNYLAVDFYMEWKKGLPIGKLIEALWKAGRRHHADLANKGRVAPHPRELLKTANFSVKNLAAPASGGNTDQHPPVVGSVVSIAAVRAARLARQADRLSKLQARLRQRNPGLA